MDMTNIERLLVGLAELAMADNEESREKARNELRAAISDVRSGRKTAEILTREIMAELGIPDVVLGHPYLLKAVLMCVSDETLINKIMMRLYPAVAAHFDTTASRVERAICHAIDLAWRRGDTDSICRYFQNTVDPERAKPTNGEFIARIANIVRNEIQA